MRYLIPSAITVVIVATLHFTTGMKLDFGYIAVLVVASWVAAYLGSRRGRTSREMPGRLGLGYAVVGLLFGTIILIVEAYRMYAMFGSGRLLVSTEPVWFVSWSDRPLGFIVAILMHLFIIAIQAGLVLFCVLEIKARVAKRLGH